MTMSRFSNQNMDRCHASAHTAEASFSCAHTAITMMDAMILASIIICTLLVLVCLLALVSLQVLVLVLVLLAVLLIPVYSPRKRKHA